MYGRAAAQKPTQASMKISDLPGDFGIGAYRPIGRRDSGRQRPDTASIMGIGRGRAICENAIIMQILLRFERRMWSL
jgi:hypothetical protein